MMNRDAVRTDHDLADQQPSYLLFLFHVELLSGIFELVREFSHGNIHFRQPLAFHGLQL